MPLVSLIALAAVLVVATIVVSIVTASEIQRLRGALAVLDRQLLEVEGRLEKLHDQRTTADGTLELHRALREEKLRRIQELTQELEWLEDDRVVDREIKVASGLRQKSIEDAFGQP